MISIYAFHVSYFWSDDDRSKPVMIIWGFVGRG